MCYRTLELHPCGEQGRSRAFELCKSRSAIRGRGHLVRFRCGAAAEGAAGSHSPSDRCPARKVWDTMGSNEVPLQFHCFSCTCNGFRADGQAAGLGVTARSRPTSPIVGKGRRLTGACRATASGNAFVRRAEKQAFDGVGPRFQESRPGWCVRPKERTLPGGHFSLQIH